MFFCLLAYIVSGEKSVAVFALLFPSMSFSLTFYDFFFVFGFQQIGNKCLGVVFIGQSCLDSVSFMDLWTDIFHQIWKFFCHYFFKYFFCPNLFSFWDSNTHMLEWWILNPTGWGSVLFGLDNINNPIFK